MENFNRKLHWENIYQTKQLNEVSWYQPTPQTSLDFIEELQLPAAAHIIDVGGGDSFLVDNLLRLGFQNISVLDISEAAIERAKMRLGAQAEKITWIAADVAAFKPQQQYHLWHDRAAFHFLTQPHEIAAYKATACQCILPGGFLVIGTFSEQGPQKCSGIPIQQYSEEQMEQLWHPYFRKLQSVTTNHPTPFNTMQSFTFCSFKKVE